MSLETLSPERTVEDAALLAERSDDRLILTINRSHAANALSSDLVEQLIDELSSLDGIRLCVIKANGRHFCAGFDLSDIESLSDADLLWRFLRVEHLLQLVQYCPVPIIGVAQGQIVGAGADLLAACWHRIATHDAQIMMPGWNFELALGTRRLVQRVGEQKASDLLIDTRKASVNEAIDCGLLNQSIAIEEYATVIEKMYNRVSHLSARAVADMLALTRTDTRDLDLAAIVKTAGRPGLKQRIMTYRQRVNLQRKARRTSAQTANNRNE